MCVCVGEREAHRVFYFLTFNEAILRGWKKIVKLALIDCLKYHGGFAF